jgi:small redox-active disulfide protein 2
MDIKVLGSGCERCKQLEATTREALARLGVDVAIEHVTDPAEIASWGVMRTPALVVDDEVRVSGRVPSVEELVTLVSA